MKRLLTFLAAGVLSVAAPAQADIVDDGADEDISLSPIGAIRAGQLEIVPIMAMRIAGGSAVYQVGMSAAYALSARHQLGGSFVMGNRLYNRTQRRVVVTDQNGVARPGSNFSVDEGFGASLTGFYRYNTPFEIKRRTYPFVEVFGGRDYGWSDAREVGGGVGVRQFINRKMAVTSQYAYAVLFAEGQRQGRHIVAAGVTMLFR